MSWTIWSSLPAKCFLMTCDMMWFWFTVSSHLSSLECLISFPTFLSSLHKKVVMSPSCTTHSLWLKRSLLRGICVGMEHKWGWKWTQKIFGNLRNTTSIQLTWNFWSAHWKTLFLEFYYWYELKEISIKFTKFV